MIGRRVAITGLGVVAPCGIGKDAYWNGLMGPGITNSRSLEITDWDAQPYFDSPKDARRADRVEHRADGPLRHELRVELLERTSGCVAGIGKSFLPSCRELRVHGFEIFRGDVSLTTHFQQRWRILQMQF